MARRSPNEVAASHFVAYSASKGAVDRGTEGGVTYHDVLGGATALHLRLPSPGAGFREIMQQRGILTMIRSNPTGS